MWATIHRVTKNPETTMHTHIPLFMLKYTKIEVHLALHFYLYLSTDYSLILQAYPIVKNKQKKFFNFHKLLM